MEFESAGILWLWGIKKVPHYLTDALKRTGTIYKCVEHTPGSIPNFKFDPAKDVVLALGDKPVQELRDFGLVKKKAKLNSCRENIVILPSGVRCLVSYSPAIREIDYNSFVLLECDVQLAARLLKTGSLAPPPLDFKWVPDLTEVLKVIKAHHNKWGSKAMDVAIDLETTGLVAYNPDTWIITFQISTDEKSSRVLKFDKDFQPVKPNPNIDQGTPQCREELIWVQINQILNDPLISMKGANLKYDLGWIYEKWGIACTNLKFDTLLVGSLLDENRSNSLKVHASLMTPYGGYENELYKKYNIAKLQEVPDDVLLPYCGYDTAVCLQVARIMKNALLAPEHRRLAKFYVNILHPAARAYERVERVGVLVDLKYYQEFKTSLEASLTKSQLQANAILPRHLHAKFEAHKDITNLSLSRAVVSAEYMFGKRGLNLKPIMFTPKSTEENPKPSTAEEHFLKFKDDPLAAPFIKVFAEYKDCEKTLSTYVDGFLSHLRYDNRFHAGFFLFKGQDNNSKKKDAGTNTGRISIKDPALQTVPKHTRWSKPLRRAFIAPEGYVILSSDYAQGELKILADLASEEAMLAAYNKGIDLHAYTGAGLAGLPFEEFISYKDSHDPSKVKIYEQYRQNAKAANFGLALANSSCLTQLGSVKIQDIQPHHKLWDGVEWVSHDGVISQGEFYVVYWDGLWATPDHKVWIKTGEKIELKDAIKRKAKLRRTATVFGKPILWESDFNQGGDSKSIWGLCFNGLHSLWETAYDSGLRFIYRENKRGFLRKGQSEQIQPRSKGTSFRDTLRCYGTALQQGYSRTITRLQRQGYSMSLYFQRALYTLGFRNVPCGELQGVGIRQDRQQGTLFSRKSTVSNQCGKPSQYGVQRLSNVSGGEAILDGLEKPLFPKKDSVFCFSGNDWGTDNREGQGFNTEEMQELAGSTTKVRGIGVLRTLWNYCTSIYMAGRTYVSERLDKPIFKELNSEFSVPRDVGGADSGESQRRNKEEAEELQKLGIPIKRTRVYDILNAGPRRRFTCEGKLVSNCYGMSAEGYKNYAETGYGVKMTITEAEESRDKFFATYPGLIPWHYSYKKLALSQGYIDSPLGRRRHLPLIDSPNSMAKSRELRRAINSPVQSTLSDFSLWSTAILEKEGITKEAPVILMVHDQLVAYLPKDNWVYYARRYRDVMENLPFHEFGWEPRVKFTVDVEISMGNPETGEPPNLANLTKVKKLVPDF